jgi:Protein of unknown function (DUF4038)/Domain of unknown function (DUF5060)/Putative collagen-binding domain of a collagenase
MAHRLQLPLVNIFCFLLLTVTASGQTVPLWGRWEQTFHASTTAAPETQFAVELTSPSGRTYSVAGFWDGGATWRVRFMPVEAGTWLYRTHSVPGLEGLDGKSGEFVCQPEAGTSRFLQHGPVRISANGRFFEHADGTPFFWVGDTVWYGAILSSKADWDTYLADRASKRFDVVHFNVVAPRNGVAADENGEISFMGGDPTRMNSRSSQLIGPILKFVGLGEEKPIRMNPRFYQRLDERIDAVNAHGLLAAIVLTWGLRPEDSGNALPEGEVVRLIRYLEARYGAHHVVWIVTGDNAYEGAGGERWKYIGRAAFGGRAHAPVTTHPLGMHWPWESFRDETWLDFIIYQSGHGDDANTLRWIHSGPPSQHWQDPPPRPFINLEPPYEGHLGYQSRQPHSDYATRRAIYWSLLNAPTAGVTYGAHGVWSWHTAVGQPPTDHPDTGVAKTWREALSFPGSVQMQYLDEFFTSIAWWTLRPDANLLAEQPGDDDPARHVSGSRSGSGDLAVMYLPVGGRLTLREGILREGLDAEWFDPRSGRRIPIQSSGQRVFHAPDQQDWVLLLSNK